MGICLEKMGQEFKAATECYYSARLVDKKNIIVLCRLSKTLKQSGHSELSKLAREISFEIRT